MDYDTNGLLQNRQVCGIFPDDVGDTFGAKAILDGVVAVRLIKRPRQKSRSALMPIHMRDNFG